MEAFGDIVNHQSFQLAQSNKLDQAPLYQEAQIWLWENVDQVARWHDAAGIGIARNKVSASMKRRLVDYIRAERDATSGAVLIDPVGDDDDDEMPFDRLNPSPIPWGRGTEAEFCDCEAAQEAEVFHQVMAVIGRLEPEQQEILRDVFIEGMSYSECARKHGVHITAVGKRVKRLIDTVRDEVGIRLAESRPHEPLRSGSQGYGIPVPLGSRNDRPRVAW